MTQRLVEVQPGLRVNVRVLGEGEPVLLIHGWSLSHEVFDRQINVLAHAGYRVLAMDMRGHGGSDAPLTGYDIDRLARDGIAVLEELASEPVAVIGWSLGGMVALRMGTQRPDLVSRMVLIASTGVAAARHESYPYGANPDRIESTYHAAELQDRLAYRAAAVGDLFQRPASPAVADWLLRISLLTPSWAANACMTTLLRTEQVDLLDQIQKPMALIIGNDDPALSVPAAKWVSERASATLIELDCGHYPMLERPDEFDAALRKTLTM